MCVHVCVRVCVCVHACVSSGLSFCVMCCSQVEQKLIERLSAGIAAWKDCLTGALQEDSIDTTMDAAGTIAQAQFKLGGHPELAVTLFLSHTHTHTHTPHLSILL